jgi:predicted metal-dependent hydrolase
MLRKIALRRRSTKPAVCKGKAMSWLEWLLAGPSHAKASNKTNANAGGDAPNAITKQSQPRSVNQPLQTRIQSRVKAQAVVTREQIQLGEILSAPITYTLIRKPRRNVGLRIDHDGLTVNAALGTPMSVIESFVRKHETWVLKKLEVWRSREIKTMQWAENTELLLRGQTIMLHWDQTKSSPVNVDGSCVKIGESRSERIAARVTQWLKREALVDFAERTMRICREHGIQPPRIMLSSAKHRWGSCNSKREVRLNWRLIQAAPELIEYVICHELAHLKHMDHSPRFWAEVGRMCPDYLRLRKQLQETDHRLKRF